MYAFSQLAAGLAVAHVVWLLSYATGAALLPHSKRGEEPGLATLHIVLSSIAGIAIYGFEGVALGFTHALTIAGIATAIVLNATAGWFLLRRRDQQERFFDDRLRELASACKGPAVFIYIVSLVLATQAAYPDYSSDGLRIHLAYAYEWYKAGHIFADHRFRFPYYTFNNEVLYALLMTCGATRYIAFLNWLSGTLAILGTYGIIAAIDSEVQRHRGTLARIVANLVYVVTPLSVALNPTFLRWDDTAMPDVAAGMLLLAVLAGFVLSAVESESTSLLPSIACCAFLAGTKPSYLFFVPVVAIGVIIASRRTCGRRAFGWPIVLALLVLSSPWYVRNALAEGDPIPPIGHFALNQPDPDFTPPEWAAILRDLHPDRSLRSIETFPYRLFVDANTTEFREYGTNALVLGIYIVLVATPVLVFRRRRSPQQAALAYCCATVLVGCSYLFFTSILARYTLLIYPALAASIGGLLLTIPARTGIFYAIPVCAFALLVPTPGSSDFYTRYRDLNYTNFGTFLSSDRHALELLAGGYTETEPILDTPWARKRYNNVLLVVADLHFIVEEAGAQPIGDWTGQNGYHAFIAAIDDHRVMEYLDRRDVGAIILNRRAGVIVGPEYDLLRRQLSAGGFTQAASDEAYASFLRRQ